jgi:hypothetical protein
MSFQTLVRQETPLILYSKDLRLPTALLDHQYHSKIQNLSLMRTARVKTGGPAFRLNGFPVGKRYARQPGRVGMVRFVKGYSQGDEKMMKKK